MAEEREKGGREAAPAEPEQPDPAQLSALLQELARAPPPSAAEAEPPPLVPGDTVGKFTIVRPIGRGGFGVVLEAVDRELGRHVAFKAMRPRRALEGKGEEWLRREAEAVARLNHPGIVTLHDFGRGPTGPYLIFELLRGANLQERLRAGPLPLREAIRVGRAAAEALAHAHASGVVHRDLKPSNVFLCAGGAVKVLDFGLARLFERAGAQSGGTPAYMAPEQWRREPEDERTDLFGLGATLHEALTGDTPYRATRSHGEVLEEGPTPRIADRRLPSRLRRLVARMLERDPALRPQTAREVASELAAIDAVLASRRTRLALGGAALAALAVIGWLALRGSPPGPLRVAVADVSNQTGERELDGLSGLLGAALEQSPRLRLVPRSELAESATGPDGRPPFRVDESNAPPAARKAGVEVLLLPAVRRGPDGYAVHLTALDPALGRTMFVVEDRAPAGTAITGLVDRIASRARAGLHERASDLRTARPVEGTTSRSMEAYGHFFEAGLILGRGTESENSSDWAEARGLYQQAVRADPTFAAAHYRVAYIYWSERNREKAAQAIAQARAHLERATPREQALILALEAFIDGRVADAAAGYERVIATWPADREAYFDLSRLLSSREGGRDLPKAAARARQAVEISPRFGSAWEQLLECEKATGRWDLVAEDARKFSRSFPSPAAYDWLGDALLNLGRHDEAREVFRQAAAVLGPHGLEGLALADLLQGRWAEAEEGYRRLSASDDPASAREGRYGLSVVSAHRGRYREAAARLEAVKQEDERRGDAADLARALGQQALWETLATGRHASGTVQRGRAVLGARREPPMVQRHFYWFAELAALAGGRTDEAEALEAEASALGSTHLANLLRMVRARAEGRHEDWRREAVSVRDPGDLAYGFHLPVAEWELELGRLDEALAAVDRALSLGVWPHPDLAAARVLLWPRALLVRARIRLARGEAAAARQDLEALLGHWKDADAGAPEVAAARALRDVVTGGAGLSASPPRAAEGRTPGPAAR